MRSQILIRRSLCAAVLAGPLLSSPALAQTRATLPTTSHPTTSTVPGATVPAGTANTAARSVLFGTVTKISGSLLLVRGRDGRLQTVNAAPAMAAGMFSAPLFVGKIIVAEGSRANGIFDAQRIARMPSLDQASPDR